MILSRASVLVDIDVVVATSQKQNGMFLSWTVELEYRKDKQIILDLANLDD